MSTSESTCWTVSRAAAAGSPSDREEPARRSLGTVREYLAARGRGSALREDFDDATQEVFVEWFRRGGPVEVAGAGRVPHFRAFRGRTHRPGPPRSVVRRAIRRPRTEGSARP